MSRVLTADPDQSARTQLQLVCGYAPTSHLDHNPGLLAACLAQLTPEQELFIRAGKMTREQQRDTTVQRGLRQVLLQAIELYCHHLDALACQEMFSVGNPQLFRQALVNVDGVHVDRNVIYVEGRGNPAHLDNGPYILPVDFGKPICP